MAQEAEKARESNGDSEVNLTATYNVEFTEGRTKKDGRWIKTGKFYWIYARYQGGKRKRISPTKIHGKQKFLTSIDNCPHKGRVQEFLRNHKGTAVRFDAENSNGYRDPDGGFQSVEGTIFDKLAGRK